MGRGGWGHEGVYVLILKNLEGLTRDLQPTTSHKSYVKVQIKPRS